jgi:hypothetical protein
MPDLPKRRRRPADAFTSTTKTLDGSRCEDRFEDKQEGHGKPRLHHPQDFHGTESADAGAVVLAKLDRMSEGVIHDVRRHIELGLFAKFIVDSNNVAA